MDEQDNGIAFTDKRRLVAGEDGPYLFAEDDVVTLDAPDRKSYLKARILDGAATEDEKNEYMSEHQEAPPEVDDTLDARAAFLVILGSNGAALATADLNAITKLPGGLPPASLDDMYSGVSLVKRDLDANTTMLNVLQGLQQQAMAAQRAQQTQQQVQDLNLNGGRR